MEKGVVLPYTRLSLAHGMTDSPELNQPSLESLKANFASYLGALLQPNVRKSYTVLDLFAGCGGLALGFEAAGFDTIGFEMDADCCRTYRSNLSSTCVEVTLNPSYSFPNADVIIGGPPCQPFSVGGDQKGFDDKRDGFPVFIKAVEEVCPDAFVFENVRGMMYQNKPYMEEIIDRLRAAGYVVDFDLIDMSNHGVPQNRKRVIAVGHKGGFSFPARRREKVTAGEALGELAHATPPESKFITEKQAEYIAKYEKASQCTRPRDLDLDQPSRTVTCRNLAGATGDMMRLKLPDGRRRRLLVREAARLQSFPDWFDFAGSETSQFNQIGNAVPPLFSLQLAQALRKTLESEEELSSEEIKRINAHPASASQMALFPQDGGQKFTKHKTNGEKSIMNPSNRVKYYLLTSEEQSRLGVTGYKYHTFDSKTPQLQSKINECLHILDKIGIPVDDKTARRKERMALAVMALGDINPGGDWDEMKSLEDGHTLSTREIIEYENDHYGEGISKGSYDDIRRKDLEHPLLDGVVVRSRPDTSRNDSTRAYAINDDYKVVFRNYESDDWSEQVAEFMRGREALEDRLKGKREIDRIKVNIPSGESIEFGPGEHNILQKKIVEDFLEMYGYGAELVYVGDAKNRILFKNDGLVSRLNISDLGKGRLPDVIAYSREKDWIYLIEAVKSFNPFSAERREHVREVVEEATTGVVYVTAFLDREAFKNFVTEIAWETEVWIASEPEHLIHFDGERFLGPYPGSRR